jgi:hypothetical protein
LSYVTSFAGDRPINARVVPNTKTMELSYRTTSNGDDDFLAVADMGVIANSNSMTFGGTYEIE